MLDPRWLIALVLLDYWAWRASHALLALCATLALLTALSVRISWRYCLRGVLYTRELERARAQHGETLELTLTFVNRKLLPLTLLEIEDTLPRHVRIRGAALRRTRHEFLPCLYIARAMLPYQRITRRVQVICERRGLHQFGPARWHSGDYLGLRSAHAGSSDTHALLVLPKVFALALDRRVSNRLLGQTARRRALLLDPLCVVGARDYQPGDPLRAMDWRATARRGALMVRELEASATPELQVVLDFQIEAPAGDRIEPDELEFNISVAASIAAHALQRRYRVGLCGNGFSGGGAIAVRSSNAPTQLAQVLEALAHATSTPSCRLEQFLARMRGRNEAGTLLVVSERLSAAACAALLDLQRAGRAVAVVLTGRHDGALPQVGIAALRIPYQQGWSARETLAFAG